MSPSISTFRTLRREARCVYWDISMTEKSSLICFFDFLMDQAGKLILIFLDISTWPRRGREGKLIHVLNRSPDRVEGHFGDRRCVCVVSFCLSKHRLCDPSVGYTVTHICVASTHLRVNIAYIWNGRPQHTRTRISISWQTQTTPNFVNDNSTTMNHNQIGRINLCEACATTINNAFLCRRKNSRTKTSKIYVK